MYNFPPFQVGKDRLYCGEHENNLEEPSKDKKLERIDCPLDSRHTVYVCKLQKHLKICNSRPPKEIPKYINPCLNRGIADLDTEEFELKDVDSKIITDVISKVNLLYEKYFSPSTIEEMFDQKLPIEIEETKTHTKHSDQVSALLGIAKYFNFLSPDTCFIEFGAGKGELAYHIAKSTEKLAGVNKVLLVDRSTFRNKKDNRIENKELVQRIKADIADLDLKALEIGVCKQIIGMSKHLCGVATDLALRCMVNGNSGEKLTKGFVIALCCHHRTTYGDFTGKNFLEENGVDAKMFKIVTKMTSWNTCGSRNEGKVDDVEKEIREKVGWKCKRIIDYGRKVYMEENGFDCSLKFYIKSETTLENVCLIGKRK